MIVQYSDRNHPVFQIIFFVLALNIVGVLVSCTKIERIAKIDIGDVLEVQSNSATVEAEIIDLGTGISEYGHCWAISPFPTANNSKTILHNATMGTFSSNLTGLIPGQKYYVRAYCVSEGEIIYSDETFFITLPSQAGTVTDADGNFYNTVTIGNQLWLAENLRTTKYNDGSDIPLVIGDYTWKNLKTPGYCWYNNDAAIYKKAYGALYNWYAVNTGKLCPIGWHVPSDTDWATLTYYLGGESVAGGKLKSTGTIGDGTGLWHSPNTGATNETGFTAVPGGGRTEDVSFDFIGYYGRWWSSTANPEYPEYSSTLCMVYNYSNIHWGYDYKSTGRSVRCVKD